MFHHSDFPYRGRRYLLCLKMSEKQIVGPEFYYHKKQCFRKRRKNQFPLPKKHKNFRHQKIILLYVENHPKNQVFFATTYLISSPNQATACSFFSLCLNDLMTRLFFACITLQSPAFSIHGFTFRLQRHIHHRHNTPSQAQHAITDMYIRPVFPESAYKHPLFRRCCQSQNHRCSEKPLQTAGCP